MRAGRNEAWKAYRLDQLGSVGRGRSRHRPRNDPSLYGGPYPFFQTGDIKAADLYLHRFTQTHNEAGLAQSKLWEPGTLCITIAANIAETAILSIPGCFPDSVVGFIADEKMADVLFIKYYIDTLKLRMQGASHGTTQDNLSVDKLLTFDFVVPDINTQSKIASILSAYDDLIENNIRRIKILEEMAQGLYREWFVHFRFPGHEKVKMVDSPLGPIPERWEVTSFTDMIDVLSGGTPKTSVPDYWDGDIPWFTPRDIEQSFYVFRTAKTITELGLCKCNSKLYPPETVFITARGTVGKCVLAAVPMAMSQTSYALIGRNGLPQCIVYLLTLNIVDLLRKNATGAVFDTIVVDTFKNRKVMEPPMSLMVKFDRVITPIFWIIKNLQAKNANLRTTRDLLLPKLISGEVGAADFFEDMGDAGKNFSAEVAR